MKVQFYPIMVCVFLFSLYLVSAVSITDVSSFPQETAPGETVNIVIEIKNIFEDDVYNINVKLDLSEENVPFAPYQSSSEKFLDELKDGEEEDFKFKLIVLPEASSGIYKIPVEITYEDGEGNISSKRELISLTVNSYPELRISLEDSKALIRGRENVFSIKIINSGLSDVKFVYLTVIDVTGIRFLSEKEQYIGDVDSDDFDSVGYDVYIAENAKSLINFKVILKFRDATNKEFIETETVMLRTYSLKQAQSLGLIKKTNYTWYVLIVFIVLIYMIRRTLKKRKSKKDRS